MNGGVPPPRSVEEEVRALVAALERDRTRKMWLVRRDVLREILRGYLERADVPLRPDELRDKGVEMI